METKVDVASMTPRECYEYARSLGLGSRRKEERTIAEESIREIGPDAVPLMLNTLQFVKDADNSKRLQTALIVVGCLAFSLWPLFTSPSQYPAAWRWLLSYLLMGGSSGILGAFLVGTDWRLELSARDLLASIADVRALNLLIESQQQIPSWRSSESAKTIVRLLNQVKASDAPILSESSRRRLIGVLDRIAAGEGRFTRDDIEYDLAVLACLEQIGEGRALLAVAKIARGENLSSYALPIRNAAREALPSFQHAVESHRVSGTLLRATDSPASSDALLRPARTTSDDSPELLIRPVGPGDLPD